MYKVSFDTTHTSGALMHPTRALMPHARPRGSELGKHGVQPRNDLVVHGSQRMDLRNDAEQGEDRGWDVHMGGDMALLAQLVAESTFPPSPEDVRLSPRASTGATGRGLSAAGARLQLRLAERTGILLLI